MSVYTHLSASEVATYLGQFSLGDYKSHQGISAGVENTNFFVETLAGAVSNKYVLTIFEHHDAAEVEGFINIGRHLAEQGVPVPGPLADKQGEYLHILKDKPAILCPCLPGSHPAKIFPNHCEQIGAALARFHLAGEDLQLEENNRGLRWWPEIGRELIQASLGAGSLGDALLTDEQQAVLVDEIEFQESHTELWFTLPRGLIHGDLFHDNALFEIDESKSADNNGDKLGAILDIYNACQDAWLFDLAIVANDWCANNNGTWIEGSLPALMAGYQSVRALTELEQQSWGMCLRAAALRFWLSRLMTQQHQAAAIAKDPMAALVTTEKDPMEYFLKLVRHRETQY
jgi:homoserine kinase type II